MRPAKAPGALHSALFQQPTNRAGGPRSANRNAAVSRDFSVAIRAGDVIAVPESTEVIAARPPRIDATLRHIEARDWQHYMSLSVLVAKHDARGFSHISFLVPLAGKCSLQQGRHHDHSVSAA